MAILDTFLALRDYIRGKISKYELMDIEPSITDVRENSSGRGSSNLIIQFDSFSEFGELIGISDDDIYFYNAITNPYSTYELYDPYYTSEDFEQGYGIWYYFNDENIELIKKIAKYILNLELDIDDETSKSEVAKKLTDFFSREVDSLMMDFSYYKNQEFLESARDSVIPEFKNYVDKFGFKLMYSDTLSISAVDLYSLFIEKDSIHLTLKELLEKIFENSEREIGGWDENRYEYQNDKYFDVEGFNDNANNIFEKILENFEDDENLQSFREMIDRITKKYKLGVWYNIPKDDELIFKIDGFDTETSKIEISLKKRGVPSKIVSSKVSEDGFNKLLYQTELFKLEL